MNEANPSPYNTNALLGLSAISLSLSLSLSLRAQVTMVTKSQQAALRLGKSRLGIRLVTTGLRPRLIYFFANSKYGLGFVLAVACEWV